MTDFANTNTTTDTNKERIAKKIRALLAKATDSSVGEHEALLFAEKAADLMAEYEISREDVDDVKEEKWGKRARPYAGGSVRRRVFHETIATTRAIARFCNCRCWTSGQDLVFFGTEQDTEYAFYLVDLIRNASENEFKRYLKSPDRPQHVHGRTLRASFLAGFTDRVYRRLYDLARQRDVKVQESKPTGNALVLVKNQELDRRFNSLGLRLTTTKSSRTVRSGAAHRAGEAAGARVSLGRGVGSGGGTRRIGN